MLVTALLDTAVMLLYSIPLMLIISTSLYFAFSAGNDRKFILIMIPIIAAFNTALLAVFFLVKLDFQAVTNPGPMYANPVFRDGLITPVGDYKVALFENSTNLSRKGFIFYKNAYMIRSVRTEKSSVSVATSSVVGNSSISPSGQFFSIPRKEQVLLLAETPVSRFALNYYISYIKKIKNIFTVTFMTNGLAASLISILILSTGFFGVIAGISGFISDRQILIMSICSLLITGVLLFAAYPAVLGLVALVKFGLKNGFFRVFLPSLTLGLLLGLLGYGLIELRSLLTRRAGAR